MAIHPNSVAANDRVKSKKATRAAMILVLFEFDQTPLSDRQIQLKLGMDERNAVSPTITDLLDSGKLVERGEIYCDYAKGMVKTVSPCDGEPVPRKRLIRTFTVNEELAKMLVHVAECEGYKSTDAYVLDLLKTQCRNHGLEVA